MRPVHVFRFPSMIQFQEVPDQHSVYYDRLVNIIDVNDEYGEFVSGY